MPLSIFDMSNTSFISPKRWRLDVVILCRQLCTCSVLSILAVAIAVMPTMAFMGVRISWLILERNSLLALVACSALLWAFSASLLASTARVRAFSAASLASSVSASCLRLILRYRRNTTPKAMNITIQQTMAASSSVSPKWSIMLFTTP